MGLSFPKRALTALEVPNAARQLVGGDQSLPKNISESMGQFPKTVGKKNENDDWHRAGALTSFKHMAEHPSPCSEKNP